MKKIVMLAVMALATAPALAQPTGPAPQAAPPSTAAPDPALARVDQQIKDMHQRLKITPAQESVWHEFAQVMRDNVAATDEAYRARAASIATMSAPDNMRNFAQIEQSRAQGVQNLTASFQTLYNTFADDQKKTADAMFRQYDQHAAARKGAPK